MIEVDYSKTVFSQGIICYNTNNNAYAIVIDGRKGSEDDRASLVIEMHGEEGFILHTPPNRALIPTGKIQTLKFLAKSLRLNVAED